MDQAWVVPGARRGFQAVAQTMVQEGKLSHCFIVCLTESFLAVEGAGGQVREVPVDKNNLITADATAAKIEDVIRETVKIQHWS